jgi:hypothetical protein
MLDTGLFQKGLEKMNIDPNTGEVLDEVPGGKSLTIYSPPPKEVTTRWATEVYPDAAKDLNEWLLSIAYWKGPGSGGSITTNVAQAALRRLQITHNLQENLERAMIMQLWDAQTSGWPQVLGKEYGGLREIMSNMLGDAKAGGGRYWDLLFWVETFLPALEYLQIDPDKIMKVPENFSKARQVLPELRQNWRELDNLHRKDVEIIADEDGGYRWTARGVGQGSFSTKTEALKDFQKSIYMVIDESEKESLRNYIMKVISIIVDPEIHVIKPLDRTGEQQVVNGQMFVTPDAEFLIIKSPTPRFTRQIELRLRGLVDGFMPTSMGLVNEGIQSEMSSKLHILNLVTGEIVTSKSKNGFSMPSEICNIARIAISQEIRSILQATSRNMDIWDIPIYSFIKLSTTGDNLVEEIADVFCIPKNPDGNEMIVLCMSVLPKAIVSFFEKNILNVCDLLLPKTYKATVMCGEIGFTDEWGVFIRVTPA